MKTFNLTASQIASIRHMLYKAQDAYLTDMRKFREQGADRYAASSSKSADEASELLEVIR